MASVLTSPSAETCGDAFMNSSRTSKRRPGRQLAIGLATAGVLTAGLAVPAYAAGTNTVTSPGVINIANAGNLVISGTATSAVTAVSVELVDTQNPGVTIAATVSADTATGKTWSASVSAAVTAGLADGTVQIFGTFDRACGQLNCSPDVTVNKDTVAPEVPTVFPDGVDTLVPATDIFIASLTDQSRTHFTFGTTAADPTEASALVPAPPLASHTVGTSEQVKAISFDPAGNPSPIMVANYTVTIPATVTTTSLVVSPVSPQMSGTAVTLSASVSATAAGNFEFFDGATSLGAGAATKTVTPTVGSHSFTARFIPTNPAAFNPSTSVAHSFTVTAPPAPPAPPLPVVERYITRVYSDLFNRTPDPGGLAGWTSALTSGTPRVAVANAITYSTEYRTKLITASYAHYLGRTPDPGGLNTWLAAMSRGWTISQMESGFIASAEYYTKSGSTDAGWVTKLYSDVLGRSAAPSEVASWTAHLRAGMRRDQVAMGFLLSTERLNTVVDGYYQHLLGRGIDPSGQRTWVGILQAGGRNEAIIGGIIASQEYYGRV